MGSSIFVPAVTAWVEEGRAKVAEIREAEEVARKLEKKLTETREAAQMRRYEMGAFLLKVRDQMPRRGTKEDGWTQFLEAIEVDDSTAHRYMELAKSAATSQGLDLRSNEPQVREGAQQPDAPPPRDDDAPAEGAVDRDEDDNRIAPAPNEPEIDRNTWCTPKEWAERLGSWDLDPCSNERSHIQAARDLRLDERKEDGLFFASQFGPGTRVFINPPYARGQVIQWVEAYAHTRFCFLLKFDPSTTWFGELMRHTGVILIPKGERVEFEPPPGVPPEKATGVQFPHAFFYAREEDISDEMRSACFPAWRIR